MSYECILCNPSNPKQDNSPARVHWHLLKKHSKQLGLEKLSMFQNKEDYSLKLRQERDGEYKQIFDILEQHTRRLKIEANRWEDVVVAVFAELQKKKLCNDDILGFGHDIYFLDVYREAYKFGVITRGKWLLKAHIMGCYLDLLNFQSHFVQFKLFCKYLSHTFMKKVRPAFKNFKRLIGINETNALDKLRSRQKNLFKECRILIESQIHPSAPEFVNRIEEVVLVTCSLIDHHSSTVINLFKLHATPTRINVIREIFLNVLHPRELSQSMLAQMLQVTFVFLYIF